MQCYYKNFPLQNILCHYIMYKIFRNNFTKVNTILYVHDSDKSYYIYYTTNILRTI